jgi:hypothetical protein
MVRADVVDLEVILDSFYVIDIHKLTPAVQYVVAGADEARFYPAIRFANRLRRRQQPILIQAETLRTSP